MKTLHEILSAIQEALVQHDQGLVLTTQTFDAIREYVDEFDPEDYHAHYVKEREQEVEVLTRLLVGNGTTASKVVDAVSVLRSEGYTVQVDTDGNFVATSPAGDWGSVTTTRSQNPMFLLDLYKQLDV